MVSKRFKSLVSEAKNSDAYWIAKAIREFTEEICKVMIRKGVTNAELARRIEAKPPYVTKILAGNANFTITSMVKLARALNYRLYNHIAPEDVQVNWVESVSSTKTNLYILHGEISTSEAASRATRNTVAASSSVKSSYTAGIDNNG